MPTPIEMVTHIVRCADHIKGQREGFGHGLDSGLEHGIPGTEIYQHDGPRAGRSADYFAGYDAGYGAGLRAGLGEAGWAALHAKMLAMVAARKTQ
jgi:hypothetical protein